MKFLTIIGPQAVGKMTVGQELENITDLKLFHNHMTIELVHPFFSYGTERGRQIVKDFRERLFTEISQSDSAGIIFTFICNFEVPSDLEYLEKVQKLFSDHGSEIYLVELEADIAERYRRNRTENRLAHKPTKRDIDFSDSLLKKSVEHDRLNSKEGEITLDNYIRIDNSSLAPDEVAKIIKDKFNL